MLYEYSTADTNRKASATNAGGTSAEVPTMAAKTEKRSATSDAAHC